jgi:hypothetical protein
MERILSSTSFNGVDYDRTDGFSPKVEDLLHELPTRCGIRIKLYVLKARHQLFPLLDPRVREVQRRFLFKRKIIGCLHDHYEPTIQKVNLHIEHTGLPDAFMDLGAPDAVKFDVLRDQVFVGPEIKSKAILLHNGCTSNDAIT